MYLKRLIIKNFRSIKFLDIPFTKGKNIIIGKNNAGKSNLIRAIDIVLGESSPTYEKYENIRESDFYTWKEMKEGKEIVMSSEELFIWCELHRDENEELNWDAIKEASGSYIKLDPLPSKEINNEEDFSDFVKEIFSVDFDKLGTGYRSTPKEKKYLDPRKELNNDNNQLNDSNNFVYVFTAWKEKTGDNLKIKKDMRFLFKNREGLWILAQRPFIRTELLQSAIVPSFRDPDSQLRLNQWSWYGKLMKHLVDRKKKEKEEKLTKAFEEVRKISNEIFEDVKKEITAASLDVAFPGAEIYFQLMEDMNQEIYKNVVIHIDDGIKSKLQYKGSGIQSATIIGLFSYYTQHVNTKTSALLCIEEPELYLHPHACRVISKRLDDFAGNKNQVIITTHNPEFIRTTQSDLNIVLVRKTPIEGTKAKFVNVKKFKDLLIDNNYTELFFADKVIICEGYDGYILRFIAGNKFDEANVSIVNAGGKDNISRFTKLALKLSLHVFILADFDYLLRDKAEERKKYKINGQPIPAHESVEDLPFVKFLGRNGSRVQSKVSILRREIKLKYEEKFYIAKRITDFEDDPDVMSKIKEVMEHLRKEGIYLLDGEIEDYVKEDYKSQILKNGKVDSSSVFKVNELLNSGKQVEDIFEVDGLKDLIELVISDRKKVD